MVSPSVRSPPVYALTQFTLSPSLLSRPVYAFNQFKLSTSLRSWPVYALNQFRLSSSLHSRPVYILAQFTFSPSFRSPSLPSQPVCALNQFWKYNTRKTEYMPRTIRVDKGSLTATVFSTSSGMGRECDKLVRLIAMKLSQKRGERYCDLVGFVPRRIRYDLIRTYFGLILWIDSRRVLRSAISCCPVQQAVVVGWDITRSRGSIWKRHEEVIQGSFEGFRGDAALH